MKLVSIFDVVLYAVLGAVLGVLGASAYLMIFSGV
jgi:hypothetical protein